MNQVAVIENREEKTVYKTVEDRINELNKASNILLKGARCLI